MNKLTRFGVSIEDELLKQFEKLNEKKKYRNRSEAIRDLIRDKLADEKIKNVNSLSFGVISFVYNHHKGDVQKKLNNIQHDFLKSIVFTTHVHIDHDNCLEIIILKEKAGRIKSISDNLLALKGVEHGKLTLLASLM